MILAYQHRLRNALLQTAALFFALSGIVATLHVLLWFGWTYSIQAAAFGSGALILLGCWQTLRHHPTHMLAQTGGTVCVLLVLFAVTATVVPGLLLMSVIAFTFALFLSALIETPRRAWWWCALSLVLYFLALLIRQSFVLVRPAYTLEFIATIYLFPLPAFIVATRLGTTLATQFRQTLESNERLQQHLHQRNEEFQRLLQTMNEGFLISDENEVFLYVNDKFCEMVGYTRTQLLNRRNEETLHYDAASLEILRQQTAIRAQNQRSSYEVRAQRKDGAAVIMLVSAMPKFDAKGVYRGAICVVLDITERKQAEEALIIERAQLSQRVDERTASLQAATATLQQELAERKQIEIALREAEHNYRTLFDNVPIGLYRSSLDGQQFRANPAMVVLNGYTSEAEMANAIKHTADWYVDPTRRVEFQRVLAAEGSVSNFESEIFRTYGRERIWIAETAILVRNQQGQPLYYQGAVQDITKRRQIENEQKRLIVQFAQVARLKDEFLASISHELRTPLNNILGMTEALLDEIYGGLTARQSKALTTVAASGRHLLTLINDILDLAKIESGQIELSAALLDVEALCQSVLRLVQATAQKKRLTVEFTLDPATRILVADGPRLKQVLLNLLSNAVKFTPAGGAIGLTVIGIKGAVSVVQFVVSDTGVGIVQDAIAQLFKPFVQLDSRLSRQYDGTGLGLALVARIVKLHGGHVSVQSEVGQGSRFTVTLPWIEADTPAMLADDGLVVAARHQPVFSSYRS